MIIIINILLLILIVYNPIYNTYECKRYAIEHIDEIDNITKNKNGYVFHYTITDTNYYTNISIRIDTHWNYYSLIMWGDRNSWKWYYKLDKDFVVDLDYTKYNNKNITIDSILINKLKILTNE